MRTAAFVNNWIGLKVVEYLSKNSELVALIVEDDVNQRHRRQIIEAAEPAAPLMLDSHQLKKKEAITELRSTQPDLGMIANFGRLLSAEIIEIFPFWGTFLRTFLELKK